MLLVPFLIYIRLERLSLSINVIRGKILGLDYSPYGVKRKDLPSVPRFVYIGLETLFLSINVIKVKIPGLDGYLNGVKRSWLPLGARFVCIRLVRKKKSLGVSSQTHLS